MNRSRSRLLVLGAILASVGVGGVLGYLSRDGRTPGGGPENLRVEAGEEGLPTDPASQLAAQLNSLIAESAGAPDPGAVRGFDPVLLLLRRNGPASEGIGERLDQPDVPPALLRELLKQLDSSDSARNFARERVDSRLASEDPSSRRLGVELIGDLRLGLSARSPTCRCVAGLYPAPTNARAARYLFAYPVAEHLGIRWSPAKTEGEELQWRLALETTEAAEGASFLLQDLEEPERPWTLILDEAHGGQIAIRATD